MLKDILNTSPNYFYIAIFVLAFSAVIVSIPSVIYTSLKYGLFDKNDLYRKNHKRNISRLGGLAIIGSFTVCILLFSAIINFKEANFLIASCIILAALGLKDDVYGTNTSTKFILQIVVAFILVFFGAFRLTSLYGVLGIGDMAPIWGSFFSIVLIIFLNNAFNLIDGIDGLAGGIGILTSLVFGILFSLMGQVPYACIAFGLAGAIAGFLKYNWFPAKIFMGDTGALIIGLISAALAIKFIELNKFTQVNRPDFYSAPAIAVAILIVPIFDSLRVFTIRILKGRSPFKGDRNHIHHRLERLGLKPNWIVLASLALNTVILVATIALQRLGNFVLIFLIIGICVVFNAALSLSLLRKRKA
ncbi:MULTISPECIES: MraY family glycosyltransferase [Pedobacter]|uniref:UDP-N-acetylmuramyl pentapeptide phosphotransferase/UDP-N-acetylglucosamine-1-phosphate transferase n=1 Tax=Pedobacter zeae TaxID=1737356 RepID=A0A7W6K9S0_9SPHI|nr:MraY family glycosyltransferase [Pedobacter zeae]MBB4107820.1 UDP-N-acetylmuramyl pentapeptide phosphotransferase/UDP-N-acetylglucosamine-1-phosphate transferase [Pedobacter zeae]GGG96824.1 undecaprenyl-phosphate alpha-N-acetylglucosaminyl 1-phosphate transferase [Pedobacter zeae]